MKNYYEILNVQEDATEQEIKKAYYAAMRQWHPDKNPDNVDEATAQSKEIVEANSVLSDPLERKRYDAERMRYAMQEDEDMDENDIPEDSTHNFQPKNFNPTMTDEEFKQLLVKELFRLLQEWTDETERRYKLGEKSLEAALKKDWELVFRLIEEGANLKIRILPRHCRKLTISNGLLGYTVLHIAIGEKKLDSAHIKALIDQGAPVNAQTDSGLAPLHLLLLRSPEPEILGLVKALVDKNAYPHFLTRKGNSPLHIAIEKKHFDAAIFLIQNPSTTINPFSKKVSSNMRRNAQNLSPLELAVEYVINESDNNRVLYWQVIESLLKRGSEVDVPSTCIQQINEAAQTKGLRVPQFIVGAIEFNRLDHKNAEEKQCLIM